MKRLINDLDFLPPPYIKSVDNPIIKLIRPHQDIFFVFFLQNILKHSQTILDVGCGYNSPLRLLTGKFYSVGIDIFRKAVRSSQNKKIHNKYVVGDVRNLSRFFHKKSFDSIVCFDVIEHMPKSQGFKLIQNMESIAKKNILIMTPNGNVDQDAYDGNPYQEHKSYWSTGDFKKLGYKVYGGRGAKYIRGKYGAIYKKPWIIWALISFISEPFFYFFPQFSFDLIAVKQLEKIITD